MELIRGSSGLSSTDIPEFASRNEVKPQNN
jgi:hypothetical protein